MGKSNSEVARMGGCRLARTVWAAGSNNLGGCRIQRREVRMNGPGSLQGGEKVALPVRDATRDMDPLFFGDLRLECPSIPEAILRSIIKNDFHLGFAGIH